MQIELNRFNLFLFPCLIHFVFHFILTVQQFKQVYKKIKTNKILFLVYYSFFSLFLVGSFLAYKNPRKIL